MAANYQGNYTMTVSVQQLCDKIRSRAFTAPLKMDFISEIPTPSGAVFQLRHGMSFTSWGEKITITLTGLNPTTTQVTIRSECTVPTQIIDWGKNKQVVNSLYQALNCGQFGFQQPMQQPMQQPIPMGNKYCLCCGNHLVINSSFCDRCGARVP